MISLIQEALWRRRLGQDEALGALKFVAQELSEPCRSWPRSFWAPPLVAQELPDQEMWRDFASVKVLCLNLGFL